jgi:hypothetical protein
MSARLTVALIIAGSLAIPSAASAATKNGITPLAPKAGSSVPAGKRPTMKMRVKGPGQVWVYVCKSKKKDAEGVICNKEAIRRAHKKRGIFRVKLPFFDFPAFWLNSPGRYYWQAFRIDCTGGTDCRKEGPIVRFRVAGG